MAPKIAIVYYSTWGHVAKLAQAESEGIKAAGGTADLFRIQETLSAEVLAKMKAPSQEASGVPVLTDPSQLEAYDAFLFGIPTRLGNFPAQWRTFWDLTGKQWFAGSFWGKYAGLFVSTGGQGGGQESTALASMSTLAHHGMIYVPLGYKPVFKQLTDLSEVHGGSPWGAGSFADNNGSRPPSAFELEIAREQGKAFYELVSRVSFAQPNGPVEQAPIAANEEANTVQEHAAASH